MATSEYKKYLLYNSHNSNEIETRTRELDCVLTFFDIQRTTIIILFFF